LEREVTERKKAEEELKRHRDHLEELVKEALGKSAYTCLYKPLDMDKLVTVLNDITRGKERGNLKKRK